MKKKMSPSTVEKCSQYKMNLQYSNSSSSGDEDLLLENDKSDINILSNSESLSICGQISNNNSDKRKNSLKQINSSDSDSNSESKMSIKSDLSLKNNKSDVNDLINNKSLDNAQIEISTLDKSKNNITTDVTKISEKCTNKEIIEETQDCDIKENKLESQTIFSSLEDLTLEMQQNSSNFAEVSNVISYADIESQIPGTPHSILQSKVNQEKIKKVSEFDEKEHLNDTINLPLNSNKSNVNALSNNKSPLKQSQMLRKTRDSKLKSVETKTALVIEESTKEKVKERKVINEKKPNAKTKTTTKSMKTKKNMSPFKTESFSQHKKMNLLHNKTSSNDDEAAAENNIPTNNIVGKNKYAISKTNLLKLNDSSDIDSKSKRSEKSNLLLHCNKSDINVTSNNKSPLKESKVLKNAADSKSKSVKRKVEFQIGEIATEKVKKRKVADEKKQKPLNKTRTKAKKMKAKEPTADAAAKEIMKLIQDTMRFNQEKIDTSNSSNDTSKYGALDIERVPSKKRYVSTTSSSDEDKRYVRTSFHVRVKPKFEDSEDDKDFETPSNLLQSTFIDKNVKTEDIKHKNNKKKRKSKVIE